VEHSLLGECPPQLKATRWKPGQSGNPKGLNGRPRFEAVVAKILDEKIPGSDVTKREAVARVFVDALLKRNGQLIKEYLAREWPAVQKHEVELPAVPDNAVEAAIDRFLAAEDEPVPAKPNGNGAAAP
jgi:hypothetical protein